VRKSSLTEEVEALYIFAFALVFVNIMLRK